MCLHIGALLGREKFGLTFGSFISSFGDAASTILGCLYLVVAIGLPIAVWLIITTKWNNKTLGSDAVLKKYRILLEGVRLTSKARALYYFYFLARRLSTSTVLVMFD